MGGGEKKKSIYNFILCHMTKRGIDTHSVPQADTAVLEAMAHTPKRWALTARTKSWTQRWGSHAASGARGPALPGVGAGTKVPGHCTKSRTKPCSDPRQKVLQENQHQLPWSRRGAARTEESEGQRKGDCTRGSIRSGR